MLPVKRLGKQASEKFVSTRMNRVDCEILGFSKMRNWYASKVLVL